MLKYLLHLYLPSSVSQSRLHTECHARLKLQRQTVHITAGVSNRESPIPAEHDFKSYSGAHDFPRLANQNTPEVHNGPEAKSIIAVSRRRDSINSVARFKNY